MIGSVGVRGDVVVDGPGVHGLRVRFEGGGRHLSVRLPSARAAASIGPHPLLVRARDRLVDYGISVDVHVGPTELLRMDGRDGSIRIGLRSALAVLLRTPPTRILRVVRLLFALRRTP